MIIFLNKNFVKLQNWGNARSGNGQYLSQRAWKFQKMENIRKKIQWNEFIVFDEFFGLEFSKFSGPLWHQNDERSWFAYNKTSKYV